MKKHVTFKEFLERSQKHHNDKYDYIEESYISISKNISIICKEHGQFTQRASHHSNGKGCRQCHFDNMKNSYSFEEFLKRANVSHNNIYSYNKDSFDSKSSNIEVACSIHGLFLQLKHNHLAGKGCPNCAIENSRVDITFNEFMELANNKHNYKYSYIKESFKNRRIDTQVICPIHGVFSIIPVDHLYGVGCKICSRSKYSPKDYSFLILKTFNNQLVHKESSWINMNHKTVVICKNHGEFEVSPYKFLYSKGCRKCYQKSNASRLELDILDFVKTLGYEVIHSDRRIISPYELDIAIPDLKVAFEVNGDYWHSDGVILKSRGVSAKEWHQYKKDLARDAGYKLYFIWECDWNNSREEVKSSVINLINSRAESPLLTKLAKEA